MDLDVHLNCGDTLMGSAHLEIHVAEEVFKALDIGQNNIVVIRITSYKAAGNTCYRCLNRNTCRHQGQSGGTDTGL